MTSESSVLESVIYYRPCACWAVLKVKKPLEANLEGPDGCGNELPPLALG